MADGCESCVSFYADAMAMLIIELFVSFRFRSAKRRCFLRWALNIGLVLLVLTVFDRCIPRQDSRTERPNWPG